MPVKWQTDESIKWPLKSLVKDLKYARDLSFYMLTREREREKPSVRVHKKGASPDYDKPVCLFCSYDKENIVRENVYYYLDALVLAGFNIVFISSSDGVSNNDLERLSSRCILIINRENKGYDFYGWKTGLEEYPQYNAHKGLLLANDSVLGPLFSIHDIVAQLESCGADIIGMTDSFNIHPHLQSYFLYCKKSVISSEEFIHFFQDMQILELKIAIIRKYEVGFSRILRHRFHLSALYGLERILARIDYHQRPLKWIEPTFHLWKPLISEFKFPFLKKSVVTRRGVSIEEVSEVLARNDSPYNANVLNDLLYPCRQEAL